MTFWSGDTIKAAGKALTPDFDEDNIDCSAYTLTLGHESYVTPQFGDAGSNLKNQLSEAITMKLGNKEHKFSGGELVIPAGQFAFLLTEEIIKIPDNTMGFISLKSKFKWKGLINVSGFHVDPGFHGRLVYSVYNAGPSNIHLSRGDRLFLLWIANLDHKSQQYVKSGNDVLLEIPTTLISEVDRPVHSLQQLSEKVDTLQRELLMLYRVFGALAIIAGLVFAAWALLPSDDSQKKSEAIVEVS